MIKVIIQLIICVSTFFAFAQKKQDSIFIYIKKDSCILKEVTRNLDYKKGFTHYAYEITCFYDDKVITDPIRFMTQTSFLEENKAPIYKPRKLLTQLKKNSKLYSYEEFIKKGKMKSFDFFVQLMNNKTKIFIIDEMESDTNILYIREVFFLKYFLD